MEVERFLILETGQSAGGNGLKVYLKQTSRFKESEKSSVLFTTIIS
jgi:hypothetical protein